MMPQLLVLLAFAAPFLFPWPLAALLAFSAAFVLPLYGILAGVLIDILYYTPGGASWPIVTVLSVVGAVLSILMHRFVKARIMGA